MRKVFSVMVLIALTAGMVWAQDEEEAAGEIKLNAGTLKISGDVKAGLRADGDTRKTWTPQIVDPSKYDEKSYTMDIYGYSDDVDDSDELTGIRADLTATYTNGPFGAKINVRQNIKNKPESGNPYDFSLSHAYGWVDLFANHVSAYGGIIGDDIWGTAWLGGTATDTSYDDVLGLRLAIKPIAPLSFGIALPFGKTPAESINQTKYDQLGNYKTFADLFGHAIIGVSFKNDAFAAALSFQLNGGSYNYALKDSGDYKVYDVAADAKEDKFYGNGLNILFGAKLTAIQKLTLVLDGKLSNFFTSQDTFWTQYIADPDDLILPKYEIYLKGAYQVLDPLTAGLRLEFSGQGSTGIETLDKVPYIGGGANDKEDQYFNLNIGIRVFADYAVTPNITPGLELEFYIAGDTANYAATYDKLPDDQKKLATHGGLSHIYFKPRCAFSLGSGLTFNVYDKIILVMANGLENPNYKGKSPADNPTELAGFVKNIFQLDFVWSF